MESNAMLRGMVFRITGIPWRIRWKITLFYVSTFANRWKREQMGRTEAFQAAWTDFLFLLFLLQRNERKLARYNLQWTSSRFFVKNSHSERSVFMRLSISGFILSTIFTLLELNFIWIFASAYVYYLPGNSVFSSMPYTHAITFYFWFGSFSFAVKSDQIIINTIAVKLFRSDLQLLSIRSRFHLCFTREPTQVQLH